MNNVQQAMHNAGLGSAELQAAHHAAIQAHVPRMCEWLYQRYENGQFEGNREGQLAAYAASHTHRFEVDVCEDHAVMSAGEVTRTVYVSVVARDDVSASLTAAQMASRHGIAVATRRVSSGA